MQSGASSNGSRQQFAYQYVLIDFDRNVVKTDDGELRIEPKLALLLRVLVDEAGSVISRDDLIARVWDGAHGADQSLTNAISQLRKMLGGNGASCIETVPKRGYRLRTSSLSEVPGDEVVPTAVSEGSTQTTPRFDKLLRYVPALGLAALLTSVLAAILLAPGSANSPMSENAPIGSSELSPHSDPFQRIDSASIAVLPFSNLSEHDDEIYFSDGISEEILNALVRVEGLRVASRTSAFTFRDSDTHRVPEIAELLNVRYVLEGSVRRSGETIRVTAQLIDAKEDRNLWSQTFDNTLTAETIFAIQEQIAQTIIEKIVQETPDFLPVENWKFIRTPQI